MKGMTGLILGTLMINSSMVFGAAFTDPVRFHGVAEHADKSTVFLIAPPLWSTEVSWPMCLRVGVKVPALPAHPAVKEIDHAAALARLRDAVRTGVPIQFGPAGVGFIRSNQDRCLLLSKAISVAIRHDGALAVISFYR